MSVLSLTGDGNTSLVQEIYQRLQLYARWIRRIEDPAFVARLRDRLADPVYSRLQAQVQDPRFAARLQNGIRRSPGTFASEAARVFDPDFTTRLQVSPVHERSRTWLSKSGCSSLMVAQKRCACRVVWGSQRMLYIIAQRPALIPPYPRLSADATAVEEARNPIGHVP